MFDIISSEEFKLWIPLYSIIISSIVAFIIGVGSWFIVHWLTKSRDIENANRTARVKELSECYKAMVRSGIKELHSLKGEDIDRTVADEVENAISIIHLYGSPEQSRLASKYCSDMQNNNTANFDELIESLRMDIRNHLGLKEIIRKPTYFKYNVSKK